MRELNELHAPFLALKSVSENVRRRRPDDAVAVLLPGTVEGAIARRTEGCTRPSEAVLVRKIRGLLVPLPLVEIPLEFLSHAESERCCKFVARGLTESRNRA